MVDVAFRYVFMALVSWHQQHHDQPIRAKPQWTSTNESGAVWPQEEELKEMVSVIDQDGDGDINFNEFVWLMTR